MVGQDGDGHRLVPLADGTKDGIDDAAVEILNGAHLQLHVALVTGLVAGLDVQIDEVVRAEGLDGGGRLALVIRVVKPRGALHVDHVHTGIDADTADQIDGRDDGRGAYAVQFAERLHGRTYAGRPRPDAVRGILTLGATLHVDRMIGQQLLRAEDEVVQAVGRSLSLGHTRLDERWTEGVQGDVVRRGAIQAPIAATEHKQMAVGDAVVKGDIVRPELLVEIANQDVGLLRRNVSRGVVLDPVAVDTDEIAAQAQLTGSEVDPHAGSLEHAAPLVDGGQVVTENRKVGHLTARVESVGHRVQSARSSELGQPIHRRRRCVLQGRQSAQFGNRLIGHAVSQNDDMLHI